MRDKPAESSRRWRSRLFRASRSRLSGSYERWDRIAGGARSSRIWQGHGRGDSRVKRAASVVLIAWIASTVGACNVVLGIDDVSSANGPDGGRGQQISGVSSDPGASAGDAATAAADDEDAEDAGLQRGAAQD